MGYKVAILGATGMVGQEMVKILEELDFPVSELRLLASEKSAGKQISFQGNQIEVEQADGKSFRDIELALFSAGSEASRKYAPIAVQSGAIVIDNSSAYRMDPSVPLIVPEVNPEEITRHQGIIANPNCSTIQLVVVLHPIRQMAGLRRLIVSTYQAVSGTGREAVSELRQQSSDILAGKKVKRKIYPHQIAFNILPHIDVFEDNGYTKEEMKIIHETRKILNLNNLDITATAARVPVFTGHSESVYLETDKLLPVEKLKKRLLKISGIKLVDDIDNNKYPLPIMTEIYDDVMVGRVRRDFANPLGINLWISANNLRKGAALNAVQIAEILHAQDLIGK